MSFSAFIGCGGSTAGAPPANAVSELSITTSSLSRGQVGTGYSATLNAAGGTPPYTWSLTGGTIPAGLSLNAATGAISGTPKAMANAASLSFMVKDSGGPSQNRSVSLALTIDPAPLAISSNSLPNGQVGTAYSASLTATGGTLPFTWTVASGTLPAGLSLNAASGVISGTPTMVANASPLTFAVTDTGSPVQSKSASLTLTIVPATLVTGTSMLPSGQVGTAYNATLLAAGGTPPYTWSLTSGTLPAGLVLNAATGSISGTPTAAVSASPLTFKVGDSGNPVQTTSVSMALTIAPAPLIVETSSLPSGQVGTPYEATLAAKGGTSPYVWFVTSGALPSGLILNEAAGAITGTPTSTADATPLRFTLVDSGNPVQNGSLSLTLTIVPEPLIVSTSPLPDGQVGTAYSATLTAAGGTSPYTWSLFSGTLPAGLSLNAATGAITGTPTATANASPLTFTVTDSGSPAQSKPLSLTLTIVPVPLAITTLLLPDGQVGKDYSATLSATGGTAPYKWSLSTGTLPAGLALNSTTGAIAGAPTAATDAVPLTFTVTDSGIPAQSKSLSLALTVTPPPLPAVSIFPLRAALTISQTLTLSATTNDPAGVRWSVSSASCRNNRCGRFSSNTSLTDVPVTFTAADRAGVYTITATERTDTSNSASISVAVTDLSGVPTYHNNLSRDGANTQEYALTASSVTATTFGRLFSCTVDGAIYAQPLWVPKLRLGSATHNVVFVATQHDSLYAFDADTNSTPCAPLWQANLLDPAHGGSPGESTVQSSGPGAPIGKGHGDIAPEVGITGTPVIDLATNTLYVVSKSMTSLGPAFFQRLHAIDLLTGNEKFSGPVTIAGTYPGTQDGGITVTFAAQAENQRAGLALVNGVVYIAWAAHEDLPPYYGWIMGYNAADLSPVSTFNVDPNAGEGGIWMSGGAPAADSQNNLYLITANGAFDATNASAPNNDYGDSFLKLSSNLTVSQYFTPSDQYTDYAVDQDFGSGGATVLIDLPANGTNPTHLVVGGGKDGYLYVLNRDNLGGLGDVNAWQRINFGKGIFATGAFWNSNFYLAGVGGNLQALALDPSTAKLNPVSTASTITFGFPGATPSVSSKPDNTDGIVWVLDDSKYCTPRSHGCSPAVLHAYDAGNLGNELWNSSQGSGNSAGYPVKFTLPTVANGKVYVGTRGNNTGGADSTTSIPGELDIYGLLPK